MTDPGPTREDIDRAVEAFWQVELLERRLERVRARHRSRLARLYTREAMAEYHKETRQHGERW